VLTANSKRAASSSGRRLKHRMARPWRGRRLLRTAGPVCRCAMTADREDALLSRPVCVARPVCVRCPAACGVRVPLLLLLLRCAVLFLSVGGFLGPLLDLRSSPCPLRCSMQCETFGHILLKTKPFPL
jgi:hypothetical protein